jgi:ubiquinone/menaquinone biosynthesis C-methylase UbiE
VTDVARRYVEEAGMSDRIALLAGDARETDWPGNQDVVLMSYLLSSVDGADIATLLGLAYSALRPGGKLIVHDFMLDERRSGPSSAALFFLSYLAYQPDAISFTSSDLKPMLAAAGFKTILDEVMIPEITKMLVAQKPE